MLVLYFYRDSELMCRLPKFSVQPHVIGLHPKRETPLCQAYRNFNEVKRT
jgi:hypothetical protein